MGYIHKCRFEDLLRGLTVEKADICEAMVFALDNAECAFEVGWGAVRVPWNPFHPFAGAYNLRYLPHAFYLSFLCCFKEAVDVIPLHSCRFSCALQAHDLAGCWYLPTFGACCLTSYVILSLATE